MQNVCNSEPRKASKIDGQLPFGASRICHEVLQSREQSHKLMIDIDTGQSDVQGLQACSLKWRAYDSEATLTPPACWYAAMSMVTPGTSY